MNVCGGVCCRVVYTEGENFFKFIIKTDQSQMFHCKIVSKGKMLLTA